MKNIFKLIYATLIISVIIVACDDEEFVGQTPSDKIAPENITDVSSLSIPGGAIINYKIPSDPDFSHVEAVYYVNQNTQRKSVSTKFIQKLTIDGFANTNTYEIKLYSVDKSGNKSNGVTTEITPLKPPYISIFESLLIRNDFSGVFIGWENPTNENSIGITVLKDDQFGDFVPYDVVYDDSSNETYENIRGLDTINVKLGFFVSDKWGNISDTLVGDFKPLYEIQLDRDNWTALQLDTNIEPNSTSLKADKTIDGNIKQARWNAFSTTQNTDKNYIPHHITYDLGNKNLYSRFIYYPTWYDAFKLGGIKVFELYGTNDQSLIDRELPGTYVWPDNDDPNITGNWREEGMDGWDLIGSFEVPKASGLPGTQYTQNCNECDREIAERGVEFNIPQGTSPYRYVRFRTIELWESALKYSSFSEIEFYGSPID
jgi:hypothetical protein